ncbi:lysozyme inhibitor LprI family protein [Acuticoccus sp. I52.16.1]|uniref:lysozyme inhibitor LprI family protein n=1 Tax=Acuticoccus sp. I52.16.1 TaxID=2928472 RepID=UPI001FD0D675|nr:hypothetical protein [Acuticoccus sp. I52.16.1]UOM35136.1 hypothetical protein MRB58_02675 [Acuticoccus sp. I52.16.1]
MLDRLAAAALMLAVLAAGTGAPPAAAQSYDCSKVMAADEKAVCNSPRLSALDDEMAKLYDAIRRCALMGTRGEVTDSQHTFMAERAACGADDACLTSLYTDRVATLGKIKREMGPGAC